MIIQSKNIWYENKFQPLQIQIDEGIIIDIKDYETDKVDYDFGTKWVLPGFIDIHDHGYNGNDANNATSKHLQEWRAYLPSEGVTSFLPTTSTESYPKLESAFQVIRQEIENPTLGARILGIHVEGPFLSHDKRGAHNPYLIRKPDIDKFRYWQDLSGNNIKMVTVAPENDDNYDFTRTISNDGVVVTIGHSNASYKVGAEAVKAGALNMTHLYNAMSQLGHRSPGIVGVGLAHEHVYAELICDGIHVDFAAGKIACLAKGENHLIAITDAVAIKGLPPGEYEREDSKQKVFVSEQGVARLSDGTLAGSTNKLNKMALNLVQEMDQTTKFAIKACTINPARLLNIDNKLGLISVGYLADIIVTDDKFNVDMTFVNGEIVYKK